MESPAHNVKIPTRNLEWRQRGNRKTIANVNCKQLQGVQGCNIANTRMEDFAGTPMAKTWFQLGAGAYVADMTSQEERSRSFGILDAMFGLGFICGPILGGCSIHTGFGFLVLRLPVSVS
jgi:MFS family permease